MTRAEALEIALARMDECQRNCVVKPMADAILAAYRKGLERAAGVVENAANRLKATFGPRGGCEADRHTAEVLLDQAASIRAEIEASNG
jgi:hypothetical protein